LLVFLINSFVVLNLFSEVVNNENLFFLRLKTAILC